jgi:5'-deoxynucleotidase YfbR-like HD superfamily hydrolase
VGNEKNGYPVPDLNKTMINVTKELMDAHKKTLKEEISEKFMEKILDMVNKNVQDALKKFQDTKNKEHEMTQTGPQQTSK